MAPTAEAALGIELVTTNPNDGENRAWIDSERYEAATPAQWDDVPVCYFRRLGENKLVVQREVYENSILRDLRPARVEDGDDSLRILHPLDLHIRTDGLFLWSPSSTHGIRIPMDSIATYAPDKFSSTTSISTTSTQTPPEALRLDMIPSDIPTTSNDDDDGFFPSLLYHIIPETRAADETEIPELQRDTDARCSAVLQAVLRAITRCQDLLPVMEDEEPRPMLMGDGVSAFTGMDGVRGLGDGGGDGGDVVRVPELAGFSGWVTSENVDEVMRAQGITNGDADADRDGAGGQITFLGPGAGARRQRGEEESADDGERIVVWQRTEE